MISAGWRKVQAGAQRHPWLVGLLVLGFLLRASYLTWGLPLSAHTGFYHADEVKAWGSTVDFPGNYLSSTNYLYGTAVQYLVALPLLPVKGALVGVYGLQDHYQFAAILFSRFCNVLMGTAAVGLVFLLGRRVFDETTALLAAGLTAVAPAHALNSGFCTLDVPMSFLLVLNFLVCLKVLPCRRLGPWLGLGVLSGILMGTKFTGGFFLAVPFLLTALRRWTALGTPGDPGSGPADLSGRRAAGGRLNNLLLYAGTACVVFAISTPHVVLSPEEYYEFMMRQKFDWYDRPPLNASAILGTWSRSTAAAVGAPTAVLAVLGMITIGRPRLDVKLTAVVFVLGYYAFWRGYLPTNFVVFVVPLLCLFAATACTGALHNKRTWLRGLGGAVTVAAIVVPLISTGIGIAQRWNDTRTRASRYIAETVPPGTTVGIATDVAMTSGVTTWRHHQWRYPKVDFGKYEEVPFLARPEILIVTSYEIERMKRALQSEHLLEGDVWDPAHRSDWYQHQPPSPAVFRFYRRLFSGTEYELVKSFTNDVDLSVGSLPPDVLIYRRRDTAAD